MNVFSDDKCSFVDILVIIPMIRHWLDDELIVIKNRNKNKRSFMKKSLFISPNYLFFTIIITAMHFLHVNETM